MNLIEEQNRDKLVLIPTSIDALIDKYNKVRTIDLFVDGFDIKVYSFVVKESI